MKAANSSGLLPTIGKARFGERGQFRRGRGSLERRHRQHPDPARLRVLADGQQSVDAQRDLAAYHVGDRLARALVRDVDELDACGRHQHFARQVLGAAGSGRGETERARLRLGEGDELLNVPGGHARIRHDDQGRDGDQGDRSEIAFGVVADFAEQVLVHSDFRWCRHQEHGAIGGGSGHRLGAYHAARAGAIVHDHRLAPSVGEPLADCARDDVGAAAGRVGHDDPDRFAGIRLGKNGGWTQEESDQAEQDGSAFHGSTRESSKLILTDSQREDA